MMKSAECAFTKPVDELGYSEAKAELRWFTRNLMGYDGPKTKALFLLLGRRLAKIHRLNKLPPDEQVELRPYFQLKAEEFGLTNLFGEEEIRDIIADILSDGPEERKLNVIDPTCWEGKPPPPREWIVPDMIPEGKVTLLFGDGGTGKSTLALQLAIARALRRHHLSTSWIGRAPKPGRTLYLSAEDDHDELHRRCAAILDHYGASFNQLEDFRAIDLVGEDAILGELQRGNTIRPTALLDLVEDWIDELRADLVVVDALADAFDGDELKRAQARQFIGLLQRAARTYGTTFLCLAHPSLNGINTGSGSSGTTGWSNSVRSRLYFEHAKASDGAEPDPDLRQISTKKTNYAKFGAPPIVVRWKDGAFVPEAGAVSSLDKLALAEKAKDVFLALLRQFNEQGQNVSPSRSSTYAPRRFATHPKAAGLSAKHLETAMQDLLDRKTIAIESFGPPSRERQRLIYVG